MQEQAEDNIQVFIRIRSLNQREIQEGADNCIEIPQRNNNQLILDSKPDNKIFNFDTICNEFSTQADIFERIGKQLVSQVLKGYNACIFAYGQTGAGKTYTIIGNEQNEEKKGLQPRTFEYLFGRIHEETQNVQNIEYLVQCNYFEIYNEQIFDLLQEDNKLQQKLQLRECLQRGIYIENIIDKTVYNSFDLMEQMKKGLANKHVGSHLMNLESSRSHSVFSLRIESQYTENNVKNVKAAKLHFVDLAGSERQKSTQAEGDRLKEAKNINKSLTILGLVINSLVECSQGKQRMIPYRDSKLTFFLRDSLGGNSKTFMIAAVSQASTQLQETLSTLKFAERAKKIKNKASINQQSVGSVENLQKEILRLKEELERVQQNQEKIQNNQPQYLYMFDEIKQQQQSPSSLQEKNKDNQILNFECQECLNYKQIIAEQTSLLQQNQYSLEQMDKSRLQRLIECKDKEIENLKKFKQNLIEKFSVSNQVQKQSNLDNSNLIIDRSFVQQDNQTRLGDQTVVINKNSQMFQSEYQHQPFQFGSDSQIGSQIKNIIEDQKMKLMRNYQQIDQQNQMYNRLSTEYAQVQQELELQQFSAQHWKNQFLEENKRYRFHYQLVQQHLKTIEELKFEKEQYNNNDKCQNQRQGQTSASIKRKIQPELKFLRQEPQQQKKLKQL